MSRFGEQAVVPVVIDIGGRTYRFAPLRYCDHAEAAATMRAGRPAPLDVVRRLGTGLDAAQQKELLALAYRDLRRGEPVELSDVVAWYRTPEGALFRRWLMLRRHQPELSLADVDTLLADVGQDEQAHLRRATCDADDLPANAESAAFDLDWARVFRELSDRTGWTPDEIAALSIRQILEHWLGRAGKTSQSMADVLTAARAEQRARAAWIEQTQLRIFNADT